MGGVHRHPVPAVVLGALILAACETVPYTGRSQLQLLSPQQEGQMGAGASVGGRPSEFLSTHPSEPTRITQIEGWMPEAMQPYKPR